MARMSLFVLLIPVMVSGCATLRAPVEEVPGMPVTIHNERAALLDLSYRCVENGPIRRLGAVGPRESQTFSVRPATCGTLYLVSQSPISVMDPDARAFATVPLFGESSVEIVFGVHGGVMRADSSGREKLLSP